MFIQVRSADMEELANRLKETEQQMERLKEAHEVLRHKNFKDSPLNSSVFIHSFTFLFYQNSCFYELCSVLLYCVVLHQ